MIFAWSLQALSPLPPVCEALVVRNLTDQGLRPGCQPRSHHHLAETMCTMGPYKHSSRPPRTLVHTVTDVGSVSISYLVCSLAGVRLQPSYQLASHFRLADSTRATCHH